MLLLRKNFTKEKYLKKLYIILLLTISLIANDTNSTKLTDEELMNRVLYTNLAGAGVVTLWGVAFWDYFSQTPKFDQERWFQNDTSYGGADKFGHLYSTYLWSLGFSALYESWGMKEDEATFYGSTTAWTFQAIMELGDSFSDSYGFSYEDFIMNTVGAGFYYIRAMNPSLKEKLDLRCEYVPKFQSNTDFFSQYNSMKYLIALKGSGFESTKSSWLKYTELQLGYYTRGYQNDDLYQTDPINGNPYKGNAKTERVVYLAIGISISELLNKAGWEKTGSVFNYVQLPYTYVPFGYDADSSSYVAPYSRPYFGYLK